MKETNETKHFIDINTQKQIISQIRKNLKFFFYKNVIFFTFTLRRTLTKKETTLNTMQFCIVISSILFSFFPIWLFFDWLKNPPLLNFDEISLFICVNSYDNSFFYEFIIKFKITHTCDFVFYNFNSLIRWFVRFVFRTINAIETFLLLVLFFFLSCQNNSVVWWKRYKTI